MSRRVIIRFVAIAVVLSGAAALRAPPIAHAGAYHVRSCFADGIAGIWQRSRTTALADAYVECPEGPNDNHGLYARNVLSQTPAPGFGAAQLYVNSPPGTYIDDIQFEANIMKSRDWRAGLYDLQNGRWLWCGVACGTSFIWSNQHVGGFGTNSLAILIVCGASQCASDGQLVAFLSLRNVTLRLQDVWNPEVAIVGGSLATGGWKRGVQTVEVEGRDNTGIAAVRALIDGQVHRTASELCDDHRLIPCSSTRRVALEVDLSKLADGPHTLEAQSVDASGNTSSTFRTILVDNTAPDPMQITAHLSGWQSANSFFVDWANPPQHASPIAGVLYRLCRDAPAAAAGCESPRRVDSPNISTLSELAAPSAGAWRLELWLEDAAGNQNEQTAREVPLLWDAEPPSVRLLTRRTDDPARLEVEASDAVSGLASTEIEIRREGESTWHSLAVEPTARGFTAVVDDERFARGTYAVRARARDHAGNERSTEDSPMTITLPVRLATDLAVGRRKFVRSGAQRRRLVLIRRPRSRYGNTIRLSGRLSAPGNNPLVDRDVEISERLKLAGDAWRPAATVRTDRTGSFIFRALPGPNRFLRFRYGGTPTIRGATSVVELRIRAASSLRVNRKRVANGQEVEFRGRVRSQPIPPTGKLLQLQVSSRGSWLTFATPRANLRGRWRHRYRFTATRGVTRYRFRVRLPRETGYPYDPGRSRSVSVKVIGL